jgi:hypothetical protein
VKCVPFRTPHWDGILWWAPDEEAARAELKQLGVPRGEVWVAAEVTALSERDPDLDEIGTAVELKAVFGGRLMGWRPETPPAMDTRQPCPTYEQRQGTVKSSSNRKYTGPPPAFDGRFSRHRPGCDCPDRPPEKPLDTGKLRA